jgi:type II secretory pathway component GspD/PulD (secretin)
MIKQRIKKTIRNTLFLSIFLTITTSVLAADAASDSPASMPEVKNEKQTDSSILLSDLAARAEHWFKMPVIVEALATYKIPIHLDKGSLTYSQLLTQLNLSGFTAYKSNGYIQIIPNREARNVDIPVVEKHKTYLEDEYVTDFLKVEKACANKVLAAIRPLVPQYGFLTVYEEANLLLIVDTYGNIQRVKAAIKAIDANLDEKEDCGRSKKSDSTPDKK